jgi:pantoate--beta-alanine ligase
VRQIETIRELRVALKPARRHGSTVGFVPTMGALHEGHLALIRQAADESDVVAVSVFVNPTQFDEASDLDAYPRTLERDAALAAEAGADLLFAPSAAEMYPAGYATTVRVDGALTETLEGAHRGRGHFDGVTTVVAKLLTIVAPDAAYFGQKDAQQALVVRRMAADLNLPVRIAVCPTVRDADGLALSSRNVRLSPADRTRALALSRGLRAAADLLSHGERDAEALAAAAGAPLRDAGIEPEYLALVDPATLSPVDTVDGEALMAVAARVGDVRLIDNVVLTPIPDPAATRS